MTDLLTPALRAKLAQAGNAENFTISRREAVALRQQIAALEAQATTAPPPLLAALSAPDYDPRPVLQAVEAEMRSAHAAHGHYYSAHHGWGVMAEELKELFDDVCVNQARRDLDHMRKEAIQVAACAARIAAMIDAGRGRV